jgi:hypothetical protein
MKAHLIDVKMFVKEIFGGLNQIENQKPQPLKIITNMVRC